MMVLSARRPDASLLEFLAARARSSSARRLTLDSVTGAAVVVAVIRWDSNLQIVVASAAACFLAYGVWGLLDRAGFMTLGRGWKRLAGAVYALRALSALFGVLAALSLMLAVWALALGTWIS
jgi:hypothetical protein